jgi:hypothetical protein
MALDAMHYGNKLQQINSSGMRFLGSMAGCRRTDGHKLMYILESSSIYLTRRNINILKEQKQNYLECI